MKSPALLPPLGMVLDCFTTFQEFHMARRAEKNSEAILYAMYRNIPPTKTTGSMSTVCIFNPPNSIRLDQQPNPALRLLRFFSIRDK